MNKTTNVLIGAAIGGAIGYFVGAVIAEIVALKEWQRDHPGEDYNDWVDDMVDGTENDPIDEDEEPKIVMGHKKNAKKSGVVKNYTQHFISEGRPDLAALAAKYNGDPVMTGDPDAPEPEGEINGMQASFLIEDELEMPEESEEKAISVITEIEFANNDDLRVVSLNFYDDDVVTDQNDNPIDRPERILGEEALVSFGVGSDDEDVVYVKNLTKKVIYEVVRTNKDYSIMPNLRRYQAKKKKEEDHGEEHTEG